MQWEPHHFSYVGLLGRGAGADLKVRFEPSRTRD